LSADGLHWRRQAVHFVLRPSLEQAMAAASWRQAGLLAAGASDTPHNHRGQRRLPIRRSHRSQHNPDPSALHVDVHPQRRSVRVAIAGELDVANVGVLQTQLDDLRDAGFAHVVLDLRKLTFMDSSGVRLILREDRLARSAGRRFSLVEGIPAVQRPLVLCGLLEGLEFGDLGQSAAQPAGRVASRPAAIEHAHRGIALQSYLAELRQQGRSPRRSAAPRF
jgi:stage II sporulation protein AA (anti-sigma F factor antagonist)